MNGLSSMEIEKRERELYSKQEQTEEDKQELRELSFRNWCNSCLIYGETWRLEANELKKYDSCFGNSTLQLYNIDIERAMEIIVEQKERFKTAKVKYNTYTDSEGCCYNSCEWD